MAGRAHILVAVELFNVFSFVVGVPGVRLAKAVVSNQGLHGNGVVFSQPIGRATWGWDDVPLHAQPLMFAGIEERLGVILRAMTTANLLETLSECVEFAFRNAAPSSPDDVVVQQATDRAKLLLPPSHSEDVEELRPFMLALVGLARQSANTRLSTPDSGE